MYKLNAYTVKRSYNLSLTTTEVKLQDNTTTSTDLNGGILSLIPVEGDIEYRKDYYDKDGSLVTGDWVKISDITPFMAIEYERDRSGLDYLRVSSGTGRIDIIKWQ